MRIAGLAGWAGGLPVALVLRDRSPEARRDALRGLAARVLGLDGEEVGIQHAPGLPPAIATPSGAGLFLSSTSRDGIAAVAVARSPIGIDVERTQATVEPPWGVLHAAEAADLRALAPGERGLAFSRMWSAKEAYLKALGTGLSREPRSVRVALGVDAGAEIDGGSSGGGSASSIAIGHEGDAFMLSLVTLAREDCRWTIIALDQQEGEAESRAGGREVVA